MGNPTDPADRKFEKIVKSVCGNKIPFPREALLFAPILEEASINAELFPATPLLGELNVLIWATAVTENNTTIVDNMINLLYIFFIVLI